MNRDNEGDGMQIRPLGDRVLVDASGSVETEKGGIIIPDMAQDKPQEAVVIDVGTGKLDDDGIAIPFNVKKGDLVLMPKYGGTEVKVGDNVFHIVREDDILAVIG